MTCHCLSGFASNPKPPTCKNGPCPICVAVAIVDEEINQAVATLQHLLVKRRDLRSEQNHVHDLMHRLPHELKTYIFGLLLPSRTEWGEIPQSKEESGTVMPSYFASICRGWRDTACSDPFLWSKMHITIGTQASKSDPSSQVSFVHDWILRSGTLPLTLHIAVKKAGLLVEEELKGVIDAIIQCSNRWHSLSLDVPLEWLRALPHSNIQCHLLRNLRINAGNKWENQRVPLLNPTASPEKVTIRRISFQSLQISWNHLSSANVEGFDLEDITQLFQHASQMTSCHISLPFCTQNSSMSPIHHQRLQTLSLCHARYMGVAPILVNFLTLPCLREFGTNEIGLLTPTYLPALIHRSACPLTKIKLFKPSPYDESAIRSDLQPLPRVTELVLEGEGDYLVIKEMLLGEYFPDLCRLTLRLQPFMLLWDTGFISMLLARKRPHPGAPDEGRLRNLKLRVVDQAAKFDHIWNSNIGQQLEAWDIGLKEDGFEFL